jgi:hypothetical protein
VPQEFRFEMLAKFGYAARGVVFLLVAALALFSSFGGGRPESKSAISSLLDQPFGKVWVGIIGIGLFCFVAWRLAQALADSDGHGSDAKGMVIRASLLGSAVTYVGLGIYAIGLSVFSGGGGGGSGEKGVATWIMSQPFGSYLAIIAGIGLFAGGVVTMIKGLTRKFEKYISIPSNASWLTYVCVYGLVARGVVFAVVGILFAYAGFKVDPDQAGGMADAMDWLSELPGGATIFIVIAAGLAAFGIYNLVAARYRTVRGPSMADVKRTVSRPFN